MNPETEKLAERIFSRIEETGDCWLWAGALNRPGGYGVIDHWKQTYYHGHKNGWRCMDCHARSERARMHRTAEVTA